VVKVGGNGGELEAEDRNCKTNAVLRRWRMNL
jgi:hypothetical protein